MEKSCGIVLFHSDEFLIIQHSVKPNVTEGHWDFPKGHVEENETEFETAVRELKEETGITDFLLIDNFKHRISYSFHKNNELIGFLFHPKLKFVLMEMRLLNAYFFGLLSR